MGYLLLTNTDSLSIKIKRNGIVKNKNVKCYSLNYLASHTAPDAPKLNATKILSHNIGYINLGMLQKNDVKKVMKKMVHTKALIFDVRFNAHGTILDLVKYLYPDPKKYLMTSIFPKTTIPGVFFKDSLITIGKSNNNYYKGKILILINENTQSHGETTAFLLRQAPNALLIGSQTAGADGHIMDFMLPGNVKVTLTGEGIIQPDIQRNGLLPDIKVIPTLENIKNHQDPVLDKAIQLAE